jgi:MFS family permease
MTPGAREVQRTYLTLTVLATLSASFIWGINTLFLLDAGLSATQAFSANAFYTLGAMVFEIPTGIVADTWGRRASYLLGALTLLLSTLLYLYMWRTQGPFWGWALSSMSIGLGFTFFSGAVEAWLVDALTFHKFDGQLESVLARGQSLGGGAMLVGSVAGGYIAQATNLGVPYLIRAGLLIATLLAAWRLMHDDGFSPDRSIGLRQEFRVLVHNSIDTGLKQRPIRWLVLAAPFTAGVGFFVFYAMQPYLLELYGDPEAFGIAGLAAAIVAGAQILGGILVPRIRRLFARRTHVLIAATAVGALTTLFIGLVSNFVVAIALLIVWAFSWSVAGPVRSAYLNEQIPSDRRATVLSFDALMGSAGGVISQPALGRSVDIWGYGISYVVSGVVSAIAIPFVFLSRSENASADIITPPDSRRDT